MSHYTLSKKAEEDVSGIYDYSVHSHGVAKAEAYLISLHETLEMLATSPDIGTSIADIREDYFQFPIHKHMVFYKRSSEGVFIVRVLHQQMKYSMHLSN